MFNLLMCGLDAWKVSVGAVVCRPPELRILLALGVEGQRLRGVGDVTAGEGLPEHAAQLGMRQG